MGIPDSKALAEDPPPNMYLFCTAFPKEFLTALSELLGQHNMLSVFTPKQNDDAVRFSLDYQMHDQYVLEKKVPL